MKLSPYEVIVDFYISLQQIFHWSPAEIDGCEVDIIFDELSVMSKKRESKRICYIDEFM